MARLTGFIFKFGAVRRRVARRAIVKAFRGEIDLFLLARSMHKRMALLALYSFMFANQRKLRIRMDELIDVLPCGCLMA